MASKSQSNKNSQQSKNDSASILKWNYNGKASWVWYVLGLLTGFGYLVGMVYVLITDNKNRVWSLFYLLGIVGLGWVGSIVLYFLFKESDRKLADMSLKLLVGNIITIILIAVLFAVIIF